MDDALHELCDDGLVEYILMMEGGRICLAACNLEPMEMELFHGKMVVLEASIPWLEVHSEASL